MFRAGDGLDLIRESVRLVLQELIETEAAEVIGARRYERTTDEPLNGGVRCLQYGQTLLLERPRSPDRGPIAALAFLPRWHAVDLEARGRPRRRRVQDLPALGT